MNIKSVIESRILKLNQEAESGEGGDFVLGGLYELNILLAWVRAIESRNSLRGTFGAVQD